MSNHRWRETDSNHQFRAKIGNAFYRRRAEQRREQSDALFAPGACAYCWGSMVRIKARPLSLANDRERRPLSTATDRAAEAVEAAERIYADEMGATLDLSPAAKTALIATITAAIQAAVAEEKQQLAWVL